MTPKASTDPAGVRQVPYDERFLDCSWEWFQDPALGKLTDTAPFTREQQRAWFDGLPGRTDYAAWGVEDAGRPVGAFGLKHITAEDAEYWAYLGEASSRGRGIGQWMFRQIVAEGRARGLTRLTGLVLKTNERALRIDLQLGFYHVSEDDTHYFIAYDL